MFKWKIQWKQNSYSFIPEWISVFDWIGQVNHSNDSITQLHLIIQFLYSALLPCRCTWASHPYTHWSERSDGGIYSQSELLCWSPCPKQPPTISWSNISESALITTQLQEKPNKTQSVFSYMTFKASYKDHRKNITCTATYPINTPDNSTVKSTVMLRVLCKNFGVILHFHKHYYVQMCVMMSCLPTDVSFALKFLQKRLTSPSIHLIQSLLLLMWLWLAKAKPVQMKWTTPGTNMDRRKSWILENNWPLM